LRGLSQFAHGPDQCQSPGGQAPGYAPEHGLRANSKRSRANFGAILKSGGNFPPPIACGAQALEEVDVTYVCTP